MAVILQIDYKLDGPFGDDMAKEFKNLARSITEEPGFNWKIWTENESEKEAGGIYCFDTKAHAEKYIGMQTKRLKASGATDINYKIFDINVPLTEVTSSEGMKISATN